MRPYDMFLRHYGQLLQCNFSSGFLLGLVPTCNIGKSHIASENIQGTTYGQIDSAATDVPDQIQITQLVYPTGIGYRQGTVCTQQFDKLLSLIHI